ncbi:ureidoglycolate dehydrogenase (NAD+) [Anaerosphaera aminiphila DSM 21120]|uniref:Ureidoglycolate dehydrogenase (NAD+) n=1 Tax=Anaerosphaera aminiphila DSM 21120 TaxID=1120995 RepID=A0A1M5UAA0_9FIRM|nr:ureidoglycolate dehydrogenase [Anaerosphaera aminiphila]SHH59838.1 ureidoglycolate dehydrogenase (NAD+) [Anaerosphaera aminiphila DSM 21120]
MIEENVVRLSFEELKELIKNKLMSAGLPTEHAEAVSDHLAYADAHGIHSHGAVRVEYYAERISKGGSNINPNISYELKSDSIGILDGDNAVGHFIANLGLKKAIALSKKSGVGVVGMKNLGHCGALSYYLRKSAEEGYITIAMAQSDPMVVMYGGVEPYFGTNPIGFCAPRKNGSPIIFDMATTVIAWGKVLDARSKGTSIPNNSAIDKDGNVTTNPNEAVSLLPIADYKGSGLMMMVDILAGVLLGQPFGKHVSSMYSDLSKGRELGLLYIVLNPEFFVGSEVFKNSIDQMVEEIHSMEVVEGHDKISYPGENSENIYKLYSKEGIPIVQDIYNYLISSDIHFNKYD